MPPLAEQAVNVELLPMNQQATTSGGPTGRLASINNMLARRFSGGEAGRRLRLEKRPGYTPLSTTTYAAGAATTAPAFPKLLDTWRDQLVLVAGTTPYVRSTARDAWERIDGDVNVVGVSRLAMQTLGKRSLYGAGSKAHAPDVAAVGNVLCYTVQDDVYGARVFLTDSDGVQIRDPFAPTGTLRAKVVSDGARFWVYSQASAQTDTYVQVFDVNGAQLATATFAWGVARARWDIIYQSATGKVALVQPSDPTLTVKFSSYAAGVITTNTFTPASASDSAALLTNTFGGTNIYAAVVLITNDIVAYEITSAGVIATTYALIAMGANYVGNISGFVENGTFDVRIAIGILQNNTITPDVSALNNRTLVYSMGHAGGLNLLNTVRSVAPVSRPFADGQGVWRAVVYYQSSACSTTAYAAAGPIADVSPLGSQPGFFVLDMSATLPGIVGHFEDRTAYAFYATSRNHLVFSPWQLASVAADASGTQHVPLGYLATQQSVSSAASLFGTRVPGFTSTTGINDYAIGQVPGTAVQSADALLLPGLQAESFDGGAVVETGLHLAPEITLAAQSAVAGALTPGEFYTWVPVYEWVDANGNVIESRPGLPYQVTMAALQTQMTLTVSTLRTSQKTGVRIAFYRTYSPTLAGTTTGVVLRRVGFVANNPAADTVNFVDVASDTDASLGQLLYSQVLTQPRAVEKHPPPPFTSGVAAFGRTFVIGFDNAVWFSSDKVEGEAQWFNPLFRIVLPKPDKMLRLTVMDSRIVIQCTGSLWSFPLGNLPNANLTAGGIPTAEQHTTTTGALGPGVMTPMGAVYAAKSGVWAMDRGLVEKFIGAPVLDSVNSTARPSGIEVDQSQRLHLTMSTDGQPRSASALTSTLVYDLVSGCWYTWTMPTTPAFATQWGGQYVYVDFDNAQVWREDVYDVSAFNDDGDPIASSITIASLNFGAETGYRSVWQVQTFAEWKGPHTLNISVAYDNDTTIVETWSQQVGHNFDDGSERYEVLPSQPDNQSMRITIADGFTYTSIGAAGTVTALAGGTYKIVLSVPTTIANFYVGQVISRASGGVIGAGTGTVTTVDSSGFIIVQPAGGFVPAGGNALYDQLDSLTPGNSFAFEALGVLVGVEQGLGRLPPTTRRIAP